MNNIFTYISLGFLLVILILQIININISKIKISNAKFKLGEIVYTYTDKKLCQHKITGIIVRKNELAYELSKSVIYVEKNIFKNYSDLRNYAIQQLDQEYNKI